MNAETPPPGRTPGTRLAAVPPVKVRQLPKEAAIWVGLLVVAWFAGKFGEQLGLPAPHVIISVIIGLVLASTGLLRRSVPRPLHTGAQAITGVVIGTYLNVHALAHTGTALAPLLAITIVTVVLSLVAGLLLARWTGMDQRTASLGMVAGGSAAIVGAAEDLEADARMVAFMQYLRLVLVILAMPLLIRLVFARGQGHFLALGAKEVEVAFTVTGAVLLVLAAIVGWWLGKLVRLPAPALLGPVIFAALVTIAGVNINPPELLREVAFNIIGLEVGLRLTPRALRAMGRMFPKVMLFVLAITGACAGLAYVITLVTNISPADAYLATTPGGINAVLAIASSVHSDVPLVFGVQTLRLLMMVLLVPPILKWYIDRRSTPTPAAHRTAPPTEAADLEYADVG